MILPIILYSIATIIVIIAIFSTIKTKNETYLLLMLISLFFYIVGVGIQFKGPTTEDIISGKAHYVEKIYTIKTTDGDTLEQYSIYKLQWKDDWKYGRKQNK